MLPPLIHKVLVCVIYDEPGACLTAQPVGAIKLLSAHHDACKTECSHASRHWHWQTLHPVQRDQQEATALAITSWIAGIDNRHHLGRIWALKLLFQPVQVWVPVILAAPAIHKACTRASTQGEHSGRAPRASAQGEHSACFVSPGRCHKHLQALAWAAPTSHLWSRQSSAASMSQLRTRATAAGTTVHAPQNLHATAWGQQA